MIRPLLQDDAFLTDVAQTRSRTSANEFSIWWLGQSGFLVQWNGRHLLLDPYLSDSLTEKYAQTDKPHVRMTELVIPPERLDFIDVVTSSHHHTDHLDAGTLIPLLRTNPRLKLVIPESSRKLVAERLQVPEESPVGLDAQLAVHLNGFSLYGVPSAHETLERDEKGRCRFLGYVIQFGRWTVYHSGDTVMYDGLTESLRPWQVDVALLPINGRAPERRVAGNLTGAEAAELAHTIGAKMVIPCHYEMFEFNTASPNEFVARCAELKQPCKVLRAGEGFANRSVSSL